MSQANFNMEDPAQQEAIRRGTHQYVPTIGKHGAYVKAQYKHQEYPKMLGKWPRPEFKQFLVTENGIKVSQDVAVANFQQAMKDWDEAMTRSVVHSKAEEQQWLKENG